MQGRPQQFLKLQGFLDDLNADERFFEMTTEAHAYSRRKACPSYLGPQNLFEGIGFGDMSWSDLL